MVDAVNKFDGFVMGIGGSNNYFTFNADDKEKEAIRFSGIARQKLGEELKLIDEKSFKFCWITDYPMYQYDEKEKKIDFSHNPFSLPQVDLKDFDKKIRELRREMEKAEEDDQGAGETLEATVK